MCIRDSHRTASDPQLPRLTVVQGGEPRALVQRALEDLGGIRRFVSRQDVVVLKPNIAWDRTPEQAANTNPEVVAEVVRQCWQAGAKRVIVTDVSCNEPRRCFQRSGIQAAARAEGAEVILPDPELYREVDLGGVVLKSWPVFTPFLEADKIFNLPIDVYKRQAQSPAGRSWDCTRTRPHVTSATAACLVARAETIPSAAFPGENPSASCA